MLCFSSIDNKSYEKAKTDNMLILQYQSVCGTLLQGRLFLLKMEIFKKRSFLQYLL